MLDLLKVLKVRKIRAELDIAEQQRVVAERKDTLEKQTSLVDKLRAKKIENLHYRQSVQSDAAKICAAFQHREKIEYELERETYYEDMARAELSDELDTLKIKIMQLEKITSKQGKVRSQIKLQAVRREFLVQEIADEEFPLATATGRST